MAEYDFGAGDEVPWNAAREPPTSHGRRFRSFSYAADRELLDYLALRHVRPFFLTEIDQFLAANPKIADHFPEFQERINTGPVLDAYKYFLTGYTKPARYTDNWLPSERNLWIPRLDEIPRMNNEHDEELFEFFGDNYRADILVEIDNEVINLSAAVLNGGYRVDTAQRKLLAFAIYGHSVDAYKFYEYNYQLHRKKDRYMPEHLILTFMPATCAPTRPGEIDTLMATVISPPGEHRKYPETRTRMARGNDEGVNPIDILLHDFIAALCRQGLRRHEIDKLKLEAIANIERERLTNGGRDIVNMVMDRASTYRPKTFNRQPNMKERARMTKIQKLSRSLGRLLDQEQNNIESGDIDFVADGITKMRQRAERELVREVTSQAQRAGTMSQKACRQWEYNFRKKVHGNRESMGNRIDVLSELARYL